MRIVLDTNVLMSGIFFSGPPFEILDAWRNQRVTLVVSAEILEEYRRVGVRLSKGYPGVDVGRFLALVAVHGEFVASPSLGIPVCEDPTDDKFFSCAVAAGCEIIVSGDKHLRRASGFGGVQVLSPRSFVEKFLVQ